MPGIIDILEPDSPLVQVFRDMEDELATLKVEYRKLSTAQVVSNIQVKEVVDRQMGRLVGVARYAGFTNKTLLESLAKIEGPLVIIVGAGILAYAFIVLNKSAEAAPAVISYIMVIVVVIGIIYVLEKFGGK